MTSLNHDNNLCLVTLPSPSSSADADKLQSKLAALKEVKKLCGFYENLKTSYNNPTNILNNLCSGLETFLGFDPTSKGYDGTGIVYSDLDRLCDAVMGFLSGVLSAVKDENAVKKYDDMMSDKLEKVLEKLTKNIGSGRTGLVESVRVVKGWLEGYEKSVNEKTENVKNVIKTLDNDIPTVITEFEKLKNKDYSDDVLRSWMRSTRTLSSSAYYASDLLVYLDANLKTKITPCVDMIKQAVVTFRSNAKRDRQELATTCSNVQVELSELEREITAFATFQNGRCVDGLQEEFDNKIKKPIFTVRAKLEEINRNLAKWSEQAVKIVSAALGKCKDILAKVTSPKNQKPKEWYDVESAAKVLFDRAQTLMKAIVAAKTALLSSVDAAHSVVLKLDEGLKKDLKDVKQKIKDRIDNINTAIKELGGIFNDAKGGAAPTDIDGIMQHIRDKVRSIKSGVGDRLTQPHSGLDLHWSQLETAIETVVKDLIGTDPAADGGGDGSIPTNGFLDYIEEGIGEYASGLKDRLLGAIGTMVESIMKNDGVVHQYLYSAMKSNSGNLKKLKLAIVSQIKNMKSLPTDRAAAGESVEETLRSIQEYLQGYAATVEGKIQNPISFIVGIEQDPVFEKAATLSSSDSVLTQAIKTVLTAVHAAVVRVQEELKTFTVNDKKLSNPMEKYNLGEQVDEAMKKVQRFRVLFNSTTVSINQAFSDVKPRISKLNDHLEKVLNDVAAPKNPKHAKNLDDAITFVSKELEKLLPDGGVFSNAGGVELTTLDTYKTYITQPSAFSDTPMQGTLPTTIKQIGEQVRAELDDILDTTNTTGEAIDSVKLEQCLQAVISGLDAFTGAVKILVENPVAAKENDPTKKSIKSLLDDLSRMLGNDIGDLYKLPQGLENIHEEISTIIGPDNSNSRNTLHSLVSETQRFHNETIREKLNKCISDITDKLKEEVTDKIKNLKKAALTQFTNRKNAELEALQSLVSTQKSAIEHIINTDSASGLKGLLSRMRGENQYALDKIKQNSHAVINLSDVMRNYFYFLFWFIEGQVKSTPSSQLVADLQARTYTLLSHLHTNNRTFTFDSGFRSLLHELTSALSTFNAAVFANPHHPQLLDALKQGMRGLVAEMEKAYVSRYDGKTITWSETPSADFKATDDAKRCAKVFMSCLPMLLNDLSKVKERCVKKGEWSDKHLHIDHEVQDARKPKNPLGTFFRDCGYIVATSQTSKQDGELRCKYGFNGAKILEKLLEMKVSAHDQIKHIKDCESNEHPLTGAQVKSENFDVYDIMSCLSDHLHEYYRVNHYATFTASKHPSNINDMLQWLTGLPHSPVYNALSHDGFSGLFEKKDEQETDNAADGFTVKFDDDDKLPAYPETITANNMRGILTLVCHHAEETLITLLGHGHSGGIYACEFNTNTAKLSYPSDPSKCLDLLFEVIGRVYNQLFFLFKQCSYRTTLGGWYDCWYGQGVGGSAWNCNTLQCPGQRGEQSAKQEHNQKCNQKCDQTAECGLKSPLQSFLEDGLPGFLPHPYSKSNCKPTCTAPGHFGKVCITPMGFNDISGMASRRQQGRHIMDVLREFCGSEHAPLSRLCGLLTCLLTRPPQTLGDMFAFYYNFLNGWTRQRHLMLTKHRENAYAKAVREANFESDANSLDVSSMFKHVSHNATHPTGDLFSLVSCDESRSDKTYCGRYLQPCGQHIWTVFSEKHAGNYLSWIVYLTETFYDLLKMLYDDCNNKCGQDRSKCNVTSCAVGCPTKSSSESGTSSQIKYHDSKCTTIVTCKSTLPTFCRYGFVFDSPQSLSGEYGDDKKRTCKDFCRALKRVLSVVKEENDVLSKLKFETIPTFLWNIRSKFFWLNVALWSLSLLYLICVMVGRLDVLHIKSHLRSPSSHRITAQSLLAAAQVGRLAKISYLQP